MGRKAAAMAMQGTLTFRTWGGKRAGAGRPKAKGRRAVAHRKRVRLKSYEPQHTTLRLVSEVANVRRWRVFAEIVSAIAAAQREGFRVIEFSVQDGHLHLITESNGWKALSDGVRALEIRIARAINRALKRKGRVFADRYHARGLGSPREVRNAIVYVLQNAKKHLAQRGVAIARGWLDVFSSAAFFAGWNSIARSSVDALRREWHSRGRDASPTRPAKTWLLTNGWRTLGLLGAHEMPAR